MCEPFSVGAVFASVGSAFRFADLAVRITEVGSENEVFIRTIHVVRDDLSEVERLLGTATMQRSLASIPGKYTWVTSALNNTNSALNEIGKWVERARAEQESTGSISFNTRVRWVFNDHEKILNRTTELMTCHQQLSNVLSYLMRLEDIPTSAEPPTYQDTTYFDDIITRHKRKTVWKASDATVAGHRTVVNRNHKVSLTPEMIPTSLNATHPFSTSTSQITGGHYATVLESPLSPALEAPTPCSPPPAYAPAVQSSFKIHTFSVDDKRHSDATCLEQNNDRPSRTKAETTCSSTAHSQSKGTRAYQMAQNYLPISELVGDTICLSGTNSYGPVNPYEYCAQLPSHISPSKNEETKAVAELLGDLSFAVELPSDDPGPPPGYPRRASISKTYKSPYNSPGSEGRGYGQRRSVPQLPAIPLRRPVPSHACSEPLNMTHELPSAPFVSSNNDPLRQRQSVIDMARQGVADSKLQHISEQPSELGCSSSTGLYQTNSQSWPLLSPASAGLTPGLSTGPHPSCGDERLILQDSVRSNGLNEPRMSFKSLEYAETASTTRMRRQKQMMDLLGSIGS